MRFIHITDTHIGQTPDFGNYGHNAYRNTTALIDLINQRRFEADFVIHTGDVVDDRSEAAYLLAKPLFAKLNLPIYYVAGNHDDADRIQRILLDKRSKADGDIKDWQDWFDRLDYSFEVGGIQFQILDTRGPDDPTGQLTEAQLAYLRQICVPDGPPLVLVMHHPPIALDTTWIDRGWKIPTMLLENRGAFIQSILPAQKRIRGVFFGHVHRAFQVYQHGILFASAPSAFAQLQSWPDQPEPDVTPHENPSFSVVTITSDSTIVRQHGTPITSSFLKP